MPPLVNILRQNDGHISAPTRLVRTKNPIEIRAALYALIALDLCASIIGTSFALNALGLDVLKLQVQQALPFMMIPLCASIGVYTFGGYRKTYSSSILKPFLQASIGAALGLATLAALTSFAPDQLADLTDALILTWCLVSFIHLAFLIVLNRLFKANRFMRKVVLIGATPHAEQLIAESQEGGSMKILGVFDDREGSRYPTDNAPNAPKQPLLGKIDDLLNWPQLPQVDQIVITVTSNATERIKMLIGRLRLLPQQVILLIDIESFNPEVGGLWSGSRSPAALVSGRPINFRQRVIKRLTDIVLSLVLIIAFSPIVLICAILIKLEDGGPVLFRQQRHGFQNELIRIWKLRSMKDNPAAETRMLDQTCQNDPRVTRIGRFIRRTSLDELPQLINVLAGEMSLVGPRPHAVGMTAETTQVHEIVKEYSHRHRVKPGITGWAQINGSRGPVHSHEEVRERVRFDIEYLNSASFLFDLYILLMTAPCLLGDKVKDR